MATQTSIDAYRTLDAASQYAQIRSVMRKIAPRSTCIADLAHMLDWERSTVSARLNELKQFGELVYDGKKKSQTTGILAMHWKLPEQPSLFV